MAPHNILSARSLRTWHRHHALECPLDPQGVQAHAIPACVLEKPVDSHAKVLSAL